MVDADPNIGDAANIKKINKKKEGNYNKVKKTKEWYSLFQNFSSKYKRIRKESWKTVNSFASRLPSCYVPDRTSPKVFTTGDVSY
jgi:phosphoenolpyruvate carboxylase